MSDACVQVLKTFGNDGDGCLSTDINAKQQQRSAPTAMAASKALTAAMARVHTTSHLVLVVSTAHADYSDV